MMGRGVGFNHKVEFFSMILVRISKLWSPLAVWLNYNDSC